MDIAFWLGEGIHPEPVHEAIVQQLTPEARLTILRIKDAWYQLPAYRREVSSTDISDAVGLWRNSMMTCEREENPHVRSIFLSFSMESV